MTRASNNPTSTNDTQSHFNRRESLKNLALLGASSAALANQNAAPADETNISRVIRQSTKFKSHRTGLKDRAAKDYLASTAAFGGRLSSPIDNLIGAAQDVHFDVLIVGSGYGGSICAARLAEKLKPGRRLALIERGKEWLPGSFPDTYPQVSDQTRQIMMGPGKGKIVNHLGLFNVLTNDEINILSASALGGTSLINANVVIRPDNYVFENECWPSALRSRKALDPYFSIVETELGVMATALDQTPKATRRRLAAEQLSREPGFIRRSPLSVMYDGRLLDGASRNRHNMIQRPCTLCGDCNTGCNVGAKNTLVYNYLPRAKRFGAEIYCQVEIHRIQPDPKGWRLHATYRDDQSGNQCNKQFCMTANKVILGAGSPASAEILMRSQSPTFRFSQMLGERWSGNGDMIGFAIKAQSGTNIGGYGAYPSNQPGVGPTVQTSIHDRSPLNPWLDLLIQEGSLPRALNGMFSILLQDRDLNRSMMMLGMGHDGNRGRVGIDEHGPTISWPGHKDGEYRQRVRHRFAQLAEAHGAKFKYLKAFGDNLVTVHPLGGCATSDHPDCGVVDELGRVYDGNSVPHSHRGVHKGLYIADGSIVPTSLAANPLLTISALAERIAHRIWSAPENGWLFNCAAKANQN